MISKELLSEVLDLKMWNTNSLNIFLEDNKVYYNGIFLGDLGYQQSVEEINIYELSYKCKEWAYGKGYELKTSTRGLVDFCSNDGLVKEFYCCSEQITEVEAIIKACEWILKEIKK